MSAILKPNKCVFLDRDGVINEERGEYTYRVEDFRLLPGAAKAIRLLKSAGYLLVVITNQSGISRGIYTREQMRACHEVLLRATGPAIDHIYYCPYHPDISESLCRKPDTLMIEKACAKFDIDLSRSWLAGDRDRDMECGVSMGLKTILIGDASTGQGKAHYRARNLLEAATAIILALDDDRTPA